MPVMMMTFITVLDRRRLRRVRVIHREVINVSRGSENTWVRVQWVKGYRRNLQCALNASRAVVYQCRADECNISQTL